MEIDSEGVRMSTLQSVYQSASLTQDRRVPPELHEVKYKASPTEHSCAKAKKKVPELT